MCIPYHIKHDTLPPQVNKQTRLPKYFMKKSSSFQNLQYRLLDQIKYQCKSALLDNILTLPAVVIKNLQHRKLIILKKKITIFLMNSINSQVTLVLKTKRPINVQQNVI